MAHLYPGITTIGCAVLAKDAAAEIFRQYPEFVDLPKVVEDNWNDFATAVLAGFGPTLSLEGPLVINA